MKQYINKDDIVAEIERRIEENKVEIQRATDKHLEEYFEGYEDALFLFKEKFLDTLEEKEVDLDEEIEKYLLANAKLLIEGDSKLVVHHIAEHFFKLGIQQAQKED